MKRTTTCGWRGSRSTSCGRSRWIADGSRLRRSGQASGWRCCRPSLESAGQEVLVARGWRIAKDISVPVIGRKASAYRQSRRQRKPPRFPGGNTDGYLAEIEWRFESGNFDEPGPCQVWARPRIPLLPGEELAPMSRSLLLADSGSGISMALDPRAYIFINVDLTVILQRDPVGEWLLMDASDHDGRHRHRPG